MDDMNPNTPLLERPLGDVEYLYWLFDRVVRTNFVVVASLQHTITTEQLTTACKYLQQQHPRLRARCSVEGKKVHFRPTSSPIPIKTIDLSTQPDSWLQQVEKEHRQPFDTQTGPLLRCTLLQLDHQKSMLITTFHHSIGDANSATQLLYKLLDIASNIHDNPPTTHTDPQDTTKQQPIEHFLPPSSRGLRGFFTLIFFLFAQLLTLFRRGIPRAETWDENVPIHNRRDRLITHSLDERDTRQLIHAAKHAQVSVHSACCAAQLLALYAELDDTSETTLGQMSLVNLKKHLKLDELPLRLSPMLSMLSTYHPIDHQTDLWTLARDIQTEVHNTLHHKATPLLLSWMGWWFRRKTLHLKKNEALQKELAQLEKDAPVVSVLSNIGRIDPPTTLPTLQSLQFFVGLSGSARFGSALCTFQGTLHWNFSYASPTFNSQRAQKIALHAINTLKHACNQQNNQTGGFHQHPNPPHI